MSLCLREQLGFAGRAGLAHGRADSATTGGNFLVGRTARSHFEFIDSIPAEDGMRMRVDKARKDNPAPPLDHFRVVRQLPFDFVGWTDRHDNAITHQHAADFDDGEIAQFGSDPRSVRAGKGHELDGV